MDVEVVGARVIGLALHHRFEHGHDLLGPLLRRPVRTVKLPGAQVHSAFRVEGGSVQVVRVPLAEGAHRGVVVAGQLGLVGIRRVRDVAPTERLDVRALVLGSRFRERERLVDLGARFLEAIVHRLGVVVVGAHRERHTPVRHRRFRVQRRRFLEREEGLVVVEAEEQDHSLVEELLRLRHGGCDRMAVRPEPGEKRHRLARGGLGRVLPESRSRAGDRGRNADRGESCPHRILLQ